MNQIDNSLVRRAVEGDKQALEDVILSVQGQVYNLALRMLRLPQDAEDATQEILIKVVTHLSEFRGDSAFTTWVYRVASNHLLNTRRRTAKLTNPSFDAMSEQLEASLTIYEANPSAVVEEKMLVEEVKRSCTLGMLMCLDRDQRLALILGELFEVSSEEGAAIMDISPAAYRKRLSRARGDGCLCLEPMRAGQSGQPVPVSQARPQQDRGRPARSTTPSLRRSNGRGKRAGGAARPAGRTQHVAPHRRLVAFTSGLPVV